MRAPILLVVVLVGCAPKPLACPSPPVLAPGPAFLWKVQRDAGPVLWLFGTVHDAGLELVPEVALTAMSQSPRFVSELGTARLDAFEDRDVLRISSGPGIDHQLGDDWWDLRDEMRGNVKEDELRRMRPWLALVRLNSLRTPKSVSMDDRLTERATQQNKPIDGLERPADQAKALDAIVTIEDLRATLRQGRGPDCAVSATIEHYAKGDLEYLQMAFVIPRTAEPLLFARNRAWLPALERYLADQGAFVAVGLGHMLGEQGLPALLAKAGYTVTRVER